MALDKITSILISVLSTTTPRDTIEITPAKPMKKNIIEFTDAPNILKERTLSVCDSVKKTHRFNAENVATLKPLRKKKEELDDIILTHMTNIAQKTLLEKDTVFVAETHSVPGDVSREQFISALKNTISVVLGYTDDTPSDGIDPIAVLTTEVLIKIESELEKRIEKIRLDNTTIETVLVEKKI
jgi:hypothetical protein